MCCERLAHAQHLFTIGFALFHAQAADAVQIGQRMRRALGNRGQGGVVKNHKCRQVVLSGHFSAPGFEPGQSLQCACVERGLGNAFGRCFGDFFSPA